MNETFEDLLKIALKNLNDKCPKCNTKLEYKGVGEYYYGHYEFHDYVCPKCKFILGQGLQCEYINEKHEFIKDNQGKEYCSKCQIYKED